MSVSKHCEACSARCAATSSALITQGAPRHTCRPFMMPCRTIRSAVMTLTSMICAAASSVISPRSAHSSARWTAMPWWLRNEHTRAWVQPLPRPVGLPARLRSRAICRSGISRARSRTSDSVSSDIVQRCLPAPFFFTFTAVWRRPANAESSRYARPRRARRFRSKSHAQSSCVSPTLPQSARSVPSCISCCRSTSPKGTGFLASIAAISASTRSSSSVSRRSVFARRCSRDTAMLAAWMT